MTNAHDKGVGRDRAGLRCASCDPAVRVTTYGGPDDPFIRVVDEWDAEAGEVDRQIFMRPVILPGAIDALEVSVGFGPEGSR